MDRKNNLNRADTSVTTRLLAFCYACIAGLVFAIANPAIAGSFDGAMGSTNYVAMTGDVNNDGQNDVLMRAFPKVVTIPLDDELDLPLVIPARSPTFLLLSTGYGTYSLVTNPDAATLNWPGWSPATQSISYAGPSGGYAGSVTIAAVVPDQASFVISMAGDTGTLQITSTTAPSANTNSAGTGASSSSAEKYAYDALGRLRRVTYPTGDNVSYFYDSAGNRTLSSITKAGTAPPEQGVFAFGGHGGHSSNGVSGDLITFTIKNIGKGTITSASATCGGGSFHSMGSFSAPTLAPGATGTIQCRAAASGAYTAAKVTMTGTNVTNSGVVFGPY